MQGTTKQDNGPAGFMCIAHSMKMQRCNINLMNAMGKVQQASASEKSEEPEATMTITLLVTNITSWTATRKKAQATCILLACYLHATSIILVGCLHAACMLLACYLHDICMILV